MHTVLQHMCHVDACMQYKSVPTQWTLIDAGSARECWKETCQSCKTCKSLPVKCVIPMQYQGLAPSKWKAITDSHDLIEYTLTKKLTCYCFLSHSLPGAEAGPALCASTTAGPVGGSGAGGSSRSGPRGQGSGGTEEGGSQKRTRRQWESWSTEDKNSFFEGLYEVAVMKRPPLKSAVVSFEMPSG